jgi:secreted trypsin-like serine protease
VTAAAGVLLLAAGPALAATVSGLNPNSSSYLVSFNATGGDYSGVAELTILRSDLGPGAIQGCSGALLSDGLRILTAAHCVADAGGVGQAKSAYVTFALPDGAFTTRAVSFEVNPHYDGRVESPYDVAILRLAEPAPSEAARYSLDSGDLFREALTLAGSSFDGTGSGDQIFDLDDSPPAPDAVWDATLAETVKAFTDTSPEPKTMFLVGVALVAVAWLGARRPPK